MKKSVFILLAFLILKSLFLRIIFKLAGKSPKKLILSLIKNENEEDIKMISCKFSTMLIDSLNPKVFEILKDRANNEDFKCIIISAGLSINIRDFLKKANLKNVQVIANELCFINKKFSGYYLRPDCYGPEKVNRYKKFYPSKNIDFFYTDCYSDKPLIDISLNSYLIKNNQNIIKI